MDNMAEAKIHLPLDGNSITPPPPYNGTTNGVSYYASNSLRSSTTLTGSFKNGSIAALG